MLGEMCELGLMEIYGFMDLLVCPPQALGAGGLSAAGWMQREEGVGGGRRLVFPLGVLCKNKTINTLNKSMLHQKTAKHCCLKEYFCSQ